MSDVTDLSEYREGWRDMPDDLAVLVEDTLVRVLAHAYNVPDKVERLREILDRHNLVFESSEDLVEFIKRKSMVLEIDEDHFVSIKGDFIEQALDEDE